MVTMLDPQETNVNKKQQQLLHKSARDVAFWLLSQRLRPQVRRASQEVWN